MIKVRQFNEIEVIIFDIASKKERIGHTPILARFI